MYSIILSHFTQHLRWWRDEGRGTCPNDNAMFERNINPYAAGG